MNSQTASEFLTTSEVQSFIDYTVAHGGGTFNANAIPVEFSYGYMVGLFGADLPLEEVTPERLRILFESFHNDPRGFSGLLLGTWIDDGRFYFDYSEHIADRGVALAKGTSYDQKAIWDCAAKESIACPPRLPELVLFPAGV